MGFGASILLIAVGAIIAFALDVQVGWLDLDVVGWVMMIAGVAGLLLTIWFWQSRRREVVTTTPAAAPPMAQQRVVDAPAGVDELGRPY